MAYPLTQQSEVAGGEVDLEKLTLATADGLDEAAQKQKVSLLARIYNELLPVVPIWERYGNNPVLDGPRVTGWPPDGDPIYINSPYADGIVTMLMLTDVIKPL
jgi:peptide/nickel transport system substrate-binding protein